MPSAEQIGGWGWAAGDHLYPYRLPVTVLPPGDAGYSGDILAASEQKEGLLWTPGPGRSALAIDVQTGRPARFRPGPLGTIRKLGQAG